MKRTASSAALAVLGCMSLVGCRDWDRFEPVTGGGDPSGGSNMGAGNVGAGDVGAGPQGGDAGGGPSGGAPSGGGVPVDCGKIDILNDDFESPFDWRWIGDTSSVSVAGGELLVPQPDGEERYFQIDTSASFDIRGRTMALELSVPPGPGQSLWWDIAGDHDNYLEFFINEAGTLNYGYEINNSFVAFDSEPFDPVAHRFMRFREENGNGHYETSPDGADWTERAMFSIDSVWDPAFTSVYIGGYVDGVTPSDGDMHIARIFSDDGPATAPCPTASISDDFDDNQRSSAWYRGWYSSMCPITESNGELRIACEADAGGEYSSAFASSAAYDLTGSSVSIEVVDFPASGSGGYLDLALTRPDFDSEFKFEVNDGQLAVKADNGGIETSMSAPYDPVAARFLRVRESNGTVYFEISPDNESFSEFHSLPVSFDITELLVIAFGGMYFATAPVDMAFDNLNIGAGP